MFNRRCTRVTSIVVLLAALFAWLTPAVAAQVNPMQAAEAAAAADSHGLDTVHAPSDEPAVHCDTPDHFGGHCGVCALIAVSTRALHRLSGGEQPSTGSGSMASHSSDGMFRPPRTLLS